MTDPEHNNNTKIVAKYLAVTFGVRSVAIERRRTAHRSGAHSIDGASTAEGKLRRRAAGTQSLLDRARARVKSGAT